jgi:hypothetical protein
MSRAMLPPSARVPASPPDDATPLADEVLQAAANATAATAACASFWKRLETMCVDLMNQDRAAARL